MQSEMCPLVLVVEDEPSNLALMRTILEKIGYGVVTASGREEALEAFRGYPTIDLLVADVNLRSGNGIEIAKMLVAQRSDLKVLLTSGWDDGITKELGVSDLVHVFLPKPFTVSQFRLAVESALNFRPSRSAAP